MQISVKTWLKNSYDLIDYDSNILVKGNVEIRNSQYVYREYNDVYSKNELISNDEDIEKLLKIDVYKNELDTYFEFERNKYGLDETDNIVTPNTSWFLLKPAMIDEKMNKYKLNPGEIIKLGRITMRIRDIIFDGKNKYNLSDSSILNDSNILKKNMNEFHTLKTEGDGVNLHLGINTRNKTNLNKKKNNSNLETIEGKKERINIIKKSSKQKSSLYSKIEKKNKTCRICYIQEEDPDNNPLVQPCKCDGSLKYIHLQCLSHWINTHSCEKLENNDKCSIYLIKPIVCELCKSKFPDYIKFKNRFFPLINFTHEYNSYLTLESLTLDKFQNKFIYVVSLEGARKIFLGKNRNCEIVLSDRSIENIHCFMIVSNKQVYLEDNDSKFGTLVLVQTKRLKLYPGIPIYLQIGRSFLEIMVKKEFKLFDCCVSEDKNNIYTYYEQNEKYIKNDMALVVQDEDEESKSFIKNNVTQEVKLYDFGNESDSFEQKDKMSDNEYLLIRRNKKNKNIKKNIYNEIFVEKTEGEQNEVDSNNEKEQPENKNIQNSIDKKKDESSEEIKIENDSESENGKQLNENQNENQNENKSENKNENKNENETNKIENNELNNNNEENQKESKMLDNNNKEEKSLNEEIQSLDEDKKEENINQIESNHIDENEINNNILKDNDENNEFKEIEKLEINKSKSSEVKVDVSEMEI